MKRLLSTQTWVVFGIQDTQCLGSKIVNLNLKELYQNINNREHQQTVPLSLEKAYKKYFVHVLYCYTF